MDNRMLYTDPVYPTHTGIYPCPCGHCPASAGPHTHEYLYTPTDEGQYRIKSFLTKRTYLRHIENPYAELYEWCYEGEGEARFQTREEAEAYCERNNLDEVEIIGP